MKRYSAGKISLMGLLFALAMVFSYLESLVSIPGLLPGMRLGPQSGDHVLPVLFGQEQRLHDGGAQGRVCGADQRRGLPGR